MTTAAERERAFRTELAALLAKHGAEMDVTDDGRPYGMHSGVCLVSMASRYDADGNELDEYTEFSL